MNTDSIKTQALEIFIYTQSRICLCCCYDNLEGDNEKQNNLLPLHFILTYGVKNSEHNPVNYHLLLPIPSDGFMFAAICKAGNKMKTFELFQAAVDY